MSYFSRFPIIGYDVSGDGNAEAVVDLTKRVAFKTGVKNNAALLRLYELESAPRPDHLADTIYDSSRQHWGIMLINDVINPYYDWIMNEQTLERFMSEKYPGSTFFVELTHDLDNSSSSSQSSSSSSTIVSNSSSSSENNSTASSSSSTAVSVTSSSSSSSSSSTFQSTGTSSSTTMSSSSSELDVTSASSGSSASSEESSATLSSSSSEVGVTSESSSSSSSTLISTSESSESSSSSQDEVANFAKGESVTFTGGGSGIVHDWDATYRQLVVKTITDVDDVDDLDDVTVVGVTTGAIAIIRKVISDSRLALHHFEGDATDDDGATIFTDVQLDPLEHISGYISKASTANVVTNYMYEDSINEQRRNIVVMNPRHTETINGNLRSLLRG